MTVPGLFGTPEVLDCTKLTKEFAIPKVRRHKPSGNSKDATLASLKI
jgi:hypothetical protein